MTGRDHLTVKAVEMVRELGLQTMVTVYYSDLRNAALSKAGLEPIGFMVSHADAVLVTFGVAMFPDVPSEQQIVINNQAEIDPDFVPDYGGQLPEKTWLLAVQPDTELHRISPDLYPGPLLGFMLDRTANLPDSFPTPEEAKDSVDTWEKNLGGVKPVVYMVPDIDLQNPGDSVDTVTKIARSLRDSGVRALAINSRQYADLPELRDVVTGLAGFPDDGTEDEVELLNMRPGATDDGASPVDLLGMAPLVNGLDALLNHPTTGLPLAIAVTAPWGAGKSSVMLQLRNRLRRPRDKSDTGFRRSWHTVDFPAWKYEKSERFWAALAKQIYDQPQEQMKSIVHRMWFRLRLEVSRLGLTKYVAKVLGIPVASVALAAFGFFLADKPPGVEAAAGGGALALILTPVAAWVSGVAGNPFKHSLQCHANRPRYEQQLGFTAEAERDVRQLMARLAPVSSASGLGILKRVWRSAMRRRDNESSDERAIAVFVDDLDRCTSNHVVEVIEAINQVFNSVNNRCVFILGMDREVVAGSIDVAYKEMVDYLAEKKSPLAEDYGYRFLSKIVQMSVAVPAPEEQGMERLLAHVTGSEPPKRASDAPLPATAVSPPPQEMVTQYQVSMGTAAMNNPVDARRRRREIEASADLTEVQRQALEIAERQVRAGLFDADSDHVKEAQFAALKFLDRNPRQVKRFDNAFRLQLHVASTTSSLDFRPEELTSLAKWVAIRLRWPQLAEDLDRESGLLEALEGFAYEINGNSPPQDLLDRYETWFESRDLMYVLANQDKQSGHPARLPFGSFLRVA